MKQTLTGLVALLVMSMGAAQSTKELPHPPPPPPKKVDVVVKAPAPPVIKITGKKADEFYQHNPTVMDISRQGSLITLKMKDGTSQKYNMSNKEEKKNFTEKYGTAPIPDPPPPPPKPKIVDVKVTVPPPPPPKPKN